MGEKDRGSAATSSSQPDATSVSPATPVTPRASSSAALPGHVPMAPSTGAAGPGTTGPTAIVVPGSNETNPESRPNVSTNWGLSLRQMIWEKWRWGVVLALAVIVSRLSSSS